MRPYETDHDRAVQLQISEEVAWVWRCEVENFPKGSRIDWVMRRDGKPWCVAEFKGLKINSWRYPDIWFNIDKYDASIEFALKYGVNTRIEVRAFFDKVMWVDLAEVDVNRNRRWEDVPQPIEGEYRRLEIYDVPMDQFQLLYHHSHGRELLLPGKDDRAWGKPRLVSSSDAPPPEASPASG